MPLLANPHQNGISMDLRLLTQCGVVQVFGAFHLQAQASCKAQWLRRGTKENTQDAKGPKGRTDPARTGPGERRQLSFSDRGKTGCRLITSIETIIRFHRICSEMLLAPIKSPPSCWAQPNP